MVKEFHMERKLEMDSVPGGRVPGYEQDHTPWERVCPRLGQGASVYSQTDTSPNWAKQENCLLWKLLPPCPATHLSLLCPLLKSKLGAGEAGKEG